MSNLARLAEKALAGGWTSLSLDEQEALRSLFYKETRKGAFHPIDDDAETFASFLRHVSNAFAPGAYLTVVDFLPYFQEIALAHAGDRWPLASLILYAAWIEHWVNVLIAMGVLRSGGTDAGLKSYFATQPRFEDKISKVRELSRSAPPKKEFDWLVQIMKTRNDYLHYTWEGRSQRALDQSLRGIGPLVRKAEKMIAGLLAFEHTEFDAPFEDLAARIFPPAR